MRSYLIIVFLIPIKGVVRVRKKRWVFISLKLALLLLLFITTYSIIDKVQLLNAKDFRSERMWYYIASYTFFGAALGCMQLYESYNRKGRWRIDYNQLVMSIPFLYFAISFAIPQYIRFPFQFYSAAAMQLSAILLGFLIVTSIKKEQII